MGSLFDSILRDTESLFTNEIALSYEYVPKLVPYREQQQKRIAACIAPLFSQHSGRNIVVFGPPGVGKTVATKHILAELEEKTTEIVPLYINCWEKNTSFKVALALCDLIDYKFTHNKKTDELFDIVASRLNKVSVVFVFDEVDKAEEVDFLYLLLQKIQYKSIILLTNHKEFITFLDMRIRSRLVPEIMEFAPYNKDEIKGILQNRIELAFVPKVWSTKAFELVVTETVALKDLRTGLYLLKESGLCTEEKSLKIISEDCVKSAILKISNFKIKNPSDLTEDTQKILSLIKTNSGLRIGDLFKKYQDVGGVGSYKTFTRKIAKLEEGKFIVVEKTEGGSQGNTSIISYNTVNKTLDDFS